MKTSRSALFHGYLLLAFMVAGCTAVQPVAPAASPDAGAATVPQTTTSLRVAAAPFLSNAAFYIALEEGYFAEEGLAIELVQMTRATDALPALAQGELDVAGTNITSALLNAMVRESGIRIVASTAQETAGMDCVYSGLVIRSGLPGASPADITAETLKPLRFSTTLPTPSGYLLDVVLAGYGLSVDEITLVDLPGSSATLAAMQEGAVDVAHFSEPWLTRVQAAGAADVWLSLTVAMSEAQSSVLAFGPSLLIDNPEAGMRFMVAYLKGVHQYQAGKTERNLKILGAYLELDQELLMSACFPHIPADGVIFTQSIEDFAAWAAARDYIDRPLTGDVFWEPRFVQHAAEVLAQP